MTDTRMASIPQPVLPGEEMQALMRFHPDVTWQGHIQEGGMGPGTPYQTAAGRATHQVIQGGRWVVGDFEQEQFLRDGTFVLKWELHWVCGWDPMMREYNATIADNYGRADVLRGSIQGDRMIFESMSDRPPFLRLTWELTPSGTVLWRNEMSLDGTAWMLVEDYEITPTD